MKTETTSDFLSLILRNPINATILERMPTLGLNDAWLVAGCLFQTVWNVRSGRPPGENIKDYDLFYFDDRDLSWEAEDRAIKHVSALFADLDATIELKNQARVHLWYGARFGSGYPQLRSSQDGIGRFLIACTCVGVRAAADGTTDVYAPYGLDDLHAGILKPNPVNDRPDLFAAKAASYKARWPWLTVAG